MVDMGEGYSRTAIVYVDVCSECNATFYTPYPNKRTCGSECSKIRQKRLKRKKYAEDPAKQIKRVKKYQESEKVNARRREKYAREKNSGS